jgi:hypothetical protein
MNHRTFYMTGGIALINMIGGFPGGFAESMPYWFCPRENRQQWTRARNHRGNARYRRTGYICASFRTDLRG